MSLAPKASTDLKPGQRLDRYELLCPIAVGGMGACWVARQQGKHQFEKLVAVKTMKDEYASDPQFQDMFLDEARIASQIDHENVARILDLGEQDGVLFLVMEFIDGDSLAKLEREVVYKNAIQIPLNILLRVIADTCGGLHSAHELCDADGQSLNVVHRDVSPQNILVNTRGVAKLIDFGVAKARNRHSSITSNTSLKGKLSYMAPEQAMMGSALDRRADVYGLGAVLYALVAGRPAYEADNQVATLAMLLAGAPIPPLPKTVPESVSAIIHRALSHSPSNRYATALEMKTALEDVMVKESLTATPETVAAFYAEHLSHRIEDRKKAIALALDGGRVSLRNLTPLSAQSSGGLRAVDSSVEPPPSSRDSSNVMLHRTPFSPGEIPATTVAPQRARLRTMAIVVGAMFVAVVATVAFMRVRASVATAETSTNVSTPAAQAAPPPAPAATSAAVATVATTTAEPAALANNGAPPAPAATAAPTTTTTATSTPQPAIRPKQRGGASGATVKKKKYDDGI